MICTQKQVSTANTQITPIYLKGERPRFKTTRTIVTADNETNLQLTKETSSIMPKLRFEIAFYVNFASNTSIIVKMRIQVVRLPILGVKLTNQKYTYQ